MYLNGEINFIDMKILSEENANTEWVKFYENFTNVGLSKFFDMDQLKEQLATSPCAISESMGTAYKGALLVHINMTLALAQRIAKMISGTLPVDDASLIKVICLMHLSKRLVYIENDNEWEIKNRGLNFKFNDDIEGVLKGGERSALEALNRGINISEIEFEAITCLDDDNDASKRTHQSQLTMIVRQANELAYAIEKERYNKSKTQK